MNPSIKAVSLASLLLWPAWPASGGWLWDDEDISVLGMTLKVVGDGGKKTLKVMDVASGGAAAAAGVKTGDSVLAVGAQPVASTDDLEDALDELPEGAKELGLTIHRSGKKRTLKLRLGTPAPAESAGKTAPGKEPGEERGPPTGVFINGKPLTQRQLGEMQAVYGAAPAAGRYWYDARGGLYGLWGREAAGFIQPGQPFGELSPRASAGNTRIFINGRELNVAEALYFRNLFGAVYPGRWWLDGRTGNVGLEGSPLPTANVFQAASRSQAAAQKGYRWSNSTGWGGSEGGCSWVNIPGSGSVMSGCD